MSRFDLTFSGEIQPGKDPSRVRAAFARLFDIRDEQRLQRFFSGDTITLRRDLDRREAADWFRKLHETGAVVALEPSRSATHSGPTAQQKRLAEQQPQDFDSALARAWQSAAQRLQQLFGTRLPELGGEEDQQAPEGVTQRPNLYAMHPFRNTADIRRRAEQAKRRFRRAAAAASILTLLALIALGWRLQLPPRPAAPVLQDMAAGPGGELYLLSGQALLRHDRAGAALGLLDLSDAGLPEIHGPLQFDGAGALILTAAQGAMYRCELNPLQCSPFGPVDFHPSALTVQPGTAAVLGADSESGVLAKFDAGGALLAHTRVQFPPDPELVVHEGLLYSTSTDAPGLRVMRPDSAALGEQLDEVLLLPQDALQRGLDRLAAFAFAGADRYAVLRNTVSGESGLYHFDKFWGAARPLLYSNGALRILSWGERLLVQQSGSSELQRFGRGGTPQAPYFSPSLRRLQDQHAGAEQWHSLGWTALIAAPALLALGTLLYARLQYLRHLVYRYGRTRGAAPVDSRASEVRWLSTLSRRRERARRAVTTGATLAAAGLLIAGGLGATLSQVTALLLLAAGPLAAIALLSLSPTGHVGVLGDELLLVDHRNMYHHGNGARLQYRPRFLMLDDVVVFTGHPLLPTFDRGELGQLAAPIVRTGIRVDRVTVWVKLLQCRHPVALAALLLLAAPISAALILLL